MSNSASGAGLPELTRLISDLEKVAREAKIIPNSGLHPGTYASAMALQCVVNFLNDMPEFQNNELLSPLWSLLTALGDLEVGVQSPILTKKANPAGGRPAMSTEMQSIYGMSAVALDALIRFDHMALDQAARKVATTLKRAGYPTPRGARNAPLHEQIKGWRARLEEGPGGKAPAFALMEWQSYKRQISAPDVVGINTDGWLVILTRKVASSRILTNPQG